MKFRLHLTKLPCARTLTNTAGARFSRSEVFTSTEITEFVSELRSDWSREALRKRFDHVTDEVVSGTKFYAIDAGATERDSCSHKAWRPKRKKKVLTAQREHRARRFEERFGLGKKSNKHVTSVPAK